MDLNSLSFLRAVKNDIEAVKIHENQEEDFWIRNCTNNGNFRLKGFGYLPKQASFIFNGPMLCGTRSIFQKQLSVFSDRLTT